VARVLSYDVEEIRRCLVKELKFYNVTTDYLLGCGEINDSSFASEEINIVTKYRLLDGRGKEAVKAALNFELSYGAKNDK
jgi:hypothetical protein